MTCLFCDPPQDRVFFSNENYYCIWDGYPVSEGHALVIPKRHCSSWFDATQDELVGLLGGIEVCRERVSQKYHPDGFNIGVNIGRSAGQTIDHLHIHVIPRYYGDVIDPRGGVRHLIPEKGNYLISENTVNYGASFEALEDDSQTLKIFGDKSNPLKYGLLKDLPQAQQLDLAVAFVTEAGLLEVLPDFREMLDRGGQIRILTGDYLDVTEPKALFRLLDLQQSYPGLFDARFFHVTSEQGFHPKAYILKNGDHEVVTYVGSSNLTKHGVLSGVEWNLRTQASEITQGPVMIEFERLYNSPTVVMLTAKVITDYASRREVREIDHVDHGLAVEYEDPPEVPTPTSVQNEALEALRATRGDGNLAGLVVLATGLGKTWLAAFDSVSFDKVLFVAHREEILNQAQESFRKIRPDAVFGRFGGGTYDSDVDVLFASIQTLGKQRYLDGFSSDAFDYIVVDEFHHAAANTYRRLIGHFDPQFLLGLTATPERTDGGDLLSLCGENLVYRCDLYEGIRRDLLSPFHYFGVADNIDFENIPWRSGRFDPSELEAAVATNTRAENAFNHWREKSQERTIAFCVSVRHADFMRDYFVEKGVRSVSVHSGIGSAPRGKSLDQLANGDIEIIFTVDMFNEGVDVPSIDTVLMLRPTESKIMWLQQLGRGLRKAATKAKLSVIDFIGNHRTFLQSPLILLGNADGSKGELLKSLPALVEGDIELPPGCFVEYDLESINLLRALAQPSGAADQVIHWFRIFTEINGRRPLANEAWHEGYDPKKVRPSYGSWIGLVNSEGELDDQERAAFADHKAFLESLEITSMNKSFKIVTLLAMIADEAFPGSIPIARLAEQVRRIARRIHSLHGEFGDALDSPSRMTKLLELNPIDKWVEGRGMGGVSYFSYQDGLFSTSFETEHEDGLVSLVQEICDYRLSQYIERSVGETRFAANFFCRVSHSGGKPILFLPPRSDNPGLPDGRFNVRFDGEEYEADFVKIAINVVRSPQDMEEKNVLPTLLKNWFGAEAGQPGRGEEVQFSLVNGVYEASPCRRIGDGLEWKDYMRAEIPRLFGLEFSAAKWNQGYVVEGDHQFLLVTLNKEGMSEEHKYEDRFISKQLFQWMSQNRTKRDSNPGRRISNHMQDGSHVHLFIRDRKKTPNGGAAPFTYLGEVEFQDWEGDAPVKVMWSLKLPVPDSVYSRFST